MSSVDVIHPSIEILPYRHWKVEGKAAGEDFHSVGEDGDSSGQMDFVCFVLRSSFRDMKGVQGVKGVKIWDECKKCEKCKKCKKIVGSGKVWR